MHWKSLSKLRSEVAFGHKQTYESTRRPSGAETYGSAPISRYPSRIAKATTFLTRRAERPGAPWPACVPRIVPGALPYPQGTASGHAN